jgi:hypothetical protein
MVQVPLTEESRQAFEFFLVMAPRQHVTYHYQRDCILEGHISALVKHNDFLVIE